MFRKRDWEECLKLAQEDAGSKTQAELEELDAILTVPSVSEHNGMKSVTIWGAENKVISADVETELLFIIGEEFNPDNGGWADRMNTAQKYVAFMIVHRLGVLYFDAMLNPSVVIII
jgi:hypothetical protein